MKLSFGFSKKAEPKRVVAAFSQKKDDGRVAITGVDAGQLKVNEKEEAAKKLVIPCKNPLQERAAATGTSASSSSSSATTKAPSSSSSSSPTAAATKPAEKRTVDESVGGLQGVAKKPKLSAEDEEALRELKKGLSGDGDASATRLAPILMREGSKKVRDGAAPMPTRDMFDNIPVEGFGEALLRGMGFDPDKHKTKAVWNDKPRDSNLGLGATPLLPSERQGAAGAKAAAKAVPRAVGAVSTGR
mmetsp:Transcript_42722/g.91632  ORF Transcript_42722/g.91632 Transcript_42722/m.91632 type:complete len:245 (-) Transcript_42722:99-833(-)